jgi:hypothetical protein
MRYASLVAVVAAAATAPALVAADSDSVSASLRSSVMASVQAALGAKVTAQGVQNCVNKCQGLLDRTAYAINTQQGDSTYEFQACVAGCGVCDSWLSKGDFKDPTTCFTTCKNTDWTQMTGPDGQPVVVQKGIVEPDKACIFGCIIQTCQGVCSDGTTDMTVTPQNKKLWWNPPQTTGCSIKTGAIRPGGYYAQNSEYNYWNSPAGAGGQQGCCSNAMNICNYKGNKKSKNYKTGVAQAQKQCANVPGAGTTVPSMCAYYADPANCGNRV